jgi:cytochrome c
MVSFVHEAVVYAKIKGLEAAKKEFSTKGGMFHRYEGQWYIYAYDFQGVNLAHGLYPDWAGVSKIDYKDANGLLVIKKLRDIAKSPKGKGWLNYQWENPATHQKDKKRGYCERVDNTMWLGSGMYSN